MQQPQPRPSPNWGRERTLRGFEGMPSEEIRSIAQLQIFRCHAPLSFWRGAGGEAKNARGKAKNRNQMTSNRRYNSPNPALPQIGEGSARSRDLKENRAKKYAQSHNFRSFGVTLPSPFGEGPGVRFNTKQVTNLIFTIKI